MSVYAEWFWRCDRCGDQGEEPWGDEEAARAEMEEHIQEVHAEGGD